MRKIKYRKKPVVVEAITFNELVEYGKTCAESFGANGMPWSFEYNGHRITHENDECYLIPTTDGERGMTPKHVLVTDRGNIYPYSTYTFFKIYEPVE